MEFVKSPLNYIGGKYKTLNQIIPAFPNDINTFVDLFGGGFNVGVNVDAEEFIYNDIIPELSELLKFFSETKPEEVVEKVEKNIEKYNISKTDKDAFVNLRARYNANHYKDLEEKSLDFYTLVLYSFNYQIRFNQSNEYNTPFGKERSSFNDNIKNNLKKFVKKLNNRNVKFHNCCYDSFDYNELNNRDFVYCDPPYLITTGSYNDGNRRNKCWDLEDEKRLLETLDGLNEKNIKFALSNVFEANGIKNELLIEWAKKYNVKHIENTFNSSNYQRKSKNDIVEVLIINY